ncbi:MAG: ribose 5-phosphate isomerase B [Lachnospiraceae bacterium]|nr:ribose 5-phosphate isomerase B [Lachnospiraceae bacterium]MDN4744296.1 ribose 5-phosphate isomerase B [Lachnospiraceae bacterium C1.1]
MASIAIGSDHGGFKLKAALIDHLKEGGYEVKDMGTYSEESCDYPEYGRAVGNAVVNGEVDYGIVICSTGIGISITANRIKGVRAALCTNEYMAKMTRLHNNANVLAMGANVIGESLAIDITDTFLNTEFSNEERHKRRIGKIDEL